MSDLAILAEGLGKRYRIGQARPRRTLRETLLHTAASPWSWLRRLGTPRPADPDGTFWALRDVSFQVRRGEAIGIIGPNGSGKSTLLKILSRITEPTAGRAELRGRVSSLLEVGTGFHPELSGRENVYLNGAILGMRRAEIRARFDEIVDFSGVERFIDTPVKRYSSGMRVRLAFAVAAHLEPDILIVDEVLAVGDARFQKKCLSRMKQAVEEARTVFFVSHNMTAIEGLCSRALLLNEGVVVADGETSQVTRDYVNESTEFGDTSYENTEPIDAPAWIQRAVLCDASGRESGLVSMSAPLKIRMLLRIEESSRYMVSVQLKESDGNPIAQFLSDDAACEIPSKSGDCEIEVEIPPLNLYPGHYLVRLCVTDTVRQTHRDLQRLSFSVIQDMDLCPRPLLRPGGLLFAAPRWQVRTLRPDSP